MNEELNKPVDRHQVQRHEKQQSGGTKHYTNQIIRIHEVDVIHYMHVETIYQNGKTHNHVDEQRDP